MYLKASYTLLITMVALLFLSPHSNAQTTDSDLMLRAIQLFDSGTYKEAEPILAKLIEEKPNDFIVHYYYGACRTENNHFTNEDLDHLIVASQEVTPVDINYYFARQYHARSNWERALKFYNKYNSLASLEGEKKLQLVQSIQQCYDKINPFEEYIREDHDLPLASNINTEATPTEPDEITPEELVDNNQAENEISVPAEEQEDLNDTEEQINFPLNNGITYLFLSQFKTEEGKENYTKGKSLEKELDKALLRAEILRDRYKNEEAANKKKLLGQDILAVENESYSLKKESMQHMYQAANAENEYWNGVASNELLAFKEELAKQKEAIQNKNQIPETTSLISETPINPELLLQGEAGEVLTQTEEPVNKDLVYKIQIGAYSRGLPTYIKRLYKKLSLIRKIDNYTDENGVVVYTTGNLSNYEDALKMQKQVRQEGVEDAYVVPYFKGKRITLKDAKQMEE